MAAELFCSGLPDSWTYGVTADGRIFFIDDENRRTTWLHPRDREPAQTGYRPLRDLPQGWEQGVTPEGALYYIDHNTHSTTFVHPITKETAAADINQGPNEAASTQRSIEKSASHSPLSPYHPDDSSSSQSPLDSKRNTLKKSPSGKTRVIDRHPSCKGHRNTQADVTMRGWLLKQDHSGPIRNWKQRWCVLSDFCLFFYKDDSESQSSGSILLPSYKVNTCDKDDGITRRFAFKVEHENMQTYFFAAETRDEMQRWLNALSLATILQRDPSVDQGPPRLPNGPTADKFRNHPGRQVDENDNSVISGNDLDDYGFPEQYPQNSMQAPPHGGSDSYQNRGWASPGYERDNGNFRDANGSDGYGYSDSRYGDRGRYDHEGQGHSYGDIGARDSYSERGYDSYDRRDVSYRGSDHVPGWRRLDRQDSYSDRENSYPDNGLRTSASGDASYRPQFSSPGHSNTDSLTRTFEPIPGTSKPREYGSLNRSEQNQPYDQRSGYRDSFGDPDARWTSDRVPPSGETYKLGYDNHGYDQRNQDYGGQDRGYDDRSPVKNSGHGDASGHLKVPTMHLRTEQGDSQRQSLAGDGDGSDSVFTDRSAQDKNVPSKADALQSLQRWHQNELGRHDLQGPQDSQAQGYNGARSDFDGGYRPDFDRQGYDSDDFGHGAGEPSIGSRYDERGSWETQNPSASNPPIQVLPKHDLSMDARSEHIYENIMPREDSRNVSHNASYDSAAFPNRPPLPVVYRDQIIRELAETKTPITQKDFMDAAENEFKRYNQQTYFQFPESPPAGQKDAPDSYYETHQRAEDLEGRPFERDDPSQGKRPVADRTNEGSDKRSSQSSQRSIENVPSFTNNGGRYDSLGRSAKPQFRPSGEPIHTIKEDPNMADTDILETKYRSLRKTYNVTPLNGHRLRLSIQPADLEGKSHEELVLLLIQLRREQSKLERNRDMYRKLVDQRRDQERHYRTIRKSGGRPNDVMEDEHDQFQQIKMRLEDLEKHIEVHKPLVNLVDNMVKMGSLYSGSTDMLVSQYKKHLLSPHEVTQPKQMLEFSRQLQEDKLVNTHKEDLEHLKQEDIDLEEKMVQLHQLDRELQELSVMVTSLQDDKTMLDRAMAEVERDQEYYKDDPREMERLTQEHRVLERQLSNVVHQLAENSRALEEVTAENSKVEMEVTLLRSKVNDISKSTSMPSLSTESYRTKVKLESELNKVQDIMDGLSKQGQQLSEAMNTLRKSNPDLTASGSKSDHPKTYLETDLDTMQSRDIGIRTPTPTTSIQRSYSERGSRDDLYRSDMEAERDMLDADDNTKRYYGFLPKDKKGQTVRDVKRESERRNRGRDPSPRFGAPLNRSQSLPRYLDGRSPEEVLGQQHVSPNYSSPPMSSYDPNTPGATQTLPTRGSHGSSNITSTPLSASFSVRSPGSTSNLPTRENQNPSSPDVLRQAAVALSRQQSLTRPQTLQRKQMSASYDALDQPSSATLQRQTSASHEVLNQRNPPEQKYAPGRAVSTSDIHRQPPLGSRDLSGHPSPDAQQQMNPDVTGQRDLKKMDRYPDVARQPGYPDVTRQPGYPDVARQPGYPDVTRQPGYPDVTNQPRNMDDGRRPESGYPYQSRHPDEARQDGYHSDSQQTPSTPDVAQQRSISKPWNPRQPSVGSAPVMKSPSDVIRNNHQNDSVSQPIAQQRPTGYGSLDRSNGTNGYGSLDRYRQTENRPESPETEVKKPFYATESEWDSYQQSPRSLGAPRDEFREDPLSDRYRNPVKESDSFRGGFHEPKQTYPDPANTSPSPKVFFKYPIPYKPPGYRTESPRGYSSDVPSESLQNNRGYEPQPVRTSQSTDSLRHQPSYDERDRYRPGDRVESHKERRHSQESAAERLQRVSVNNSCSSDRTEQNHTPISPQLRRPATLPVGTATNQKNGQTPSAADRLFPRGDESPLSQSPRSSARGTPQRTASPLGHQRRSSPRSPGEKWLPKTTQRSNGQTSQSVQQKQVPIPSRRSDESIQKHSKLPLNNTEEAIRPTKMAGNMHLPDEPKRDFRGRFQTVASSVPARMEYEFDDSEPEQNGKSDDDDNEEMLRKIRKKGRQYSFDDTTIDRLILSSPDKVEIPERYIPEDEEELTPEERERREKKVERIRKLLSAQSLQDWTKIGDEDSSRSLHDTVSMEKKRREMVLEMREKLARQVTLRSKQVAVIDWRAEANKKQRRKTWSGGNSKSWKDVEG